MFCTAGGSASRRISRQAAVALAGEGRRTAHKSGCTHLAAGVDVSRGAPEGAVSGRRRSAAHSEPDRGGGSRGAAAHVRPRMVYARAQRRRTGAVDRRTAGRARHPAAGSGLCALFPPRPDHIAGISEVRGAKRLLVPEEEYFWSCRVNLRYTSRRLWIDEPPERFWYRVNHIGPESRSYDLFGDDSVHLVHIAGHTEGMFAALIRNGERYVLLTPTVRQVPAHGRRVRCPVSAKTVCAPKRRSTGSAA